MAVSWLNTLYARMNMCIHPGAPWHQWTSLSPVELPIDDGRLPDGNRSVIMYSTLGRTCSSMYFFTDSSLTFQNQTIMQITFKKRKNKTSELSYISTLFGSKFFKLVFQLISLWGQSRFLVRHYPNICHFVCLLICEFISYIFCNGLVEMFRQSAMLW